MSTRGRNYPGIAGKGGCGDNLAGRGEFREVGGRQEHLAVRDQ